MNHTVLSLCALLVMANPGLHVLHTAQKDPGREVIVTPLAPTVSGHRTPITKGLVSDQLRVVVRDRDTWEQVWAHINPVPNSGFDVTKLEAAQNLFNPLSLDRCRDSSEPCVVNMDDFFTTRANQSRGHKTVLRSDVIAHFYPGYVKKIRFLFTQPEHLLFGRTQSGPSLRCVWPLRRRSKAGIKETNRRR